MKKALSVCLVFLLAVSLVACGQREESPNTESLETETIHTASDEMAEDGSDARTDPPVPLETEDSGEDAEGQIQITVGDTELFATLEDNRSTAALKELLKDGPQTISGRNYGGFEKVCSLGTSIAADDVYITTKPGDIVLYQGNSICFYYAQNSWDFTMLGHIEGLTDGEIRDILSGPETEVIIELIR